MRSSDLQYLTTEEINKALENITNPRHRLLFLFMADAGLLPSECIALQFENFDFENKKITITKSPHAKFDRSRSIPFSDRLLQELGNYIRSLPPGTIGDRGAWLFPWSNSTGHIPRDFPAYALKKIRGPGIIKSISSWSLRCSFVAQQLAAGASLNEVREMLGNVTWNTMAAYAKTVLFLTEKINRPERKESSLRKKYREIFSLKDRKLNSTIDISYATDGKITIGRTEIIKQLTDHINRKINTVIIGDVGTGKSHLLGAIEESSILQQIKILKIDDIQELKATLTQMLLYLLETDPKGVSEHLFPEYDHSQALTEVSRHTIIHMARVIIKLTPKNEFILIIDNIDQIGIRTVKVLEIFKDHFTIITTARSIPLNRASLVWNFAIIRLKPLEREYAIQLIEKLSKGVEPEDFWLYKNHIYEQTNGNPRAIYEIIERYRKEPAITNETVRFIRHTGALPEYDCTFIVLLFLASVACLRYLNHEVQNASFRVLGGIAMVFLFISRYFFRSSRKTSV